MSAHAYRSEEADRIVEGALRGIAADLAALRVPRLAGVVLGGGYGRGEGGVKPDGRLSNDLDFYALVAPGSGDRVADAAAQTLVPLGRKWSERLGLDVDFTVKTPERMKKDEARLMVQELVRGYCDVWGKAGEELFAQVARRAAEDVPRSEAVRLLANRGAGLLLAREPGRDPEFVARNIAKGVMGAGDARLVARGAYRWKAEERREALGDARYAAALAWKFRPREEPPCTWEEAREAWLAAAEEVGRGAERRRTVRNALRWVVRRRTWGDWRTAGWDPEERLLAGIARVLGDGVAEGTVFPKDLRRDWEVFG
jgi:hypothetical protein